MFRGDLYRNLPSVSMQVTKRLKIVKPGKIAIMKGNCAVASRLDYTGMPIEQYSLVFERTFCYLDANRVGNLGQLVKSGVA